MTRRKYAVLLAFAMFVAAGSLAGCGSGSNSTSTQNQSQAAKANVTIAAKFPSADGAVKSLIPAGAQVIEVYAQTMPYTYDPNNPNGTLIATLSPTEQSKTVQITPGNYMVYAIAYDTADVTSRTIVGQTSTGGEVKSGQSNTIILTFLDGLWTIVNASDVATPIVLSDGTTQLNDFIVEAGGGSASPMYKASKSSINYSSPVGGGSGVVRLRFNNNTSARTDGWMATQFIGTSNSNILSSDSYNLTKKCGFSSYYGLPCDEMAGDQMVMISSKDTGSSGYQSGGSYESNILYGSAETLLPGGGQTSFTQNGTPLDLSAAIPDTSVTGGTIITGGIIEWKPSTNRTTTLATSVAKTAKSVLAIKAQSANTPYANLTVKNYETIVCSGSNPQNRGTWTFANNTSAGKVVLGNRVCYTNSPYLSGQPSSTPPYQYVRDPGDYSYGLVPADVNNLGDYCYQWDMDMYLPYDQVTNPSYTTPNPNYNKACKIKTPDIPLYEPWNFMALKSATKTTINYGSFKFNFWGESTQTGTAYIYPFRAKGNTTITPAK
ncbi:MAG: hypothetical protein PHI31_00075 [Desulfuromonadaceae bacterium]|nr:hypothetical protein [Desulfuromonadaceae bacterium]